MPFLFLFLFFRFFSFFVFLNSQFWIIEGAVNFGKRTVVDWWRMMKMISLQFCPFILLFCACRPIISGIFYLKNIWCAKAFSIISYNLLGVKRRAAKIGFEKFI